LWERTISEDFTRRRFDDRTTLHEFPGGGYSGLLQAVEEPRGAEFITEPLDKYGERRCYIRDPDGYIIEVGQSKPEFRYG
jgi:hypothetical protein